MAKFGFSVADVDMTQQGGGNYDPIPEGDYVLKALDAENKETSSGGEMIKVKFEVVEGDFKGRWIWQNFNTVNKSEKAQNIGRQQLVAWAIAAGKPDVDDTDKLIGRPFTATVVIEPGNAGYKDSNQIRSFLQSEAAEKPAQKAPPKPTKQAEKPAGKPANPWD